MRAGARACRSCRPRGRSWWTARRWGGGAGLGFAGQSAAADTAAALWITNLRVTLHAHSACLRCPSLQVKMATLQLFGSDDQCAAAAALIEEAVSNKEQKAKQRQKEYDKKKEVGFWGWLFLVPAALPSSFHGQAQPAECAGGTTDPPCQPRPPRPAPSPARPCLPRVF